MARSPTSGRVEQAPPNGSDHEDVALGSSTSGSVRTFLSAISAPPRNGVDPLNVCSGTNTPTEQTGVDGMIPLAFRTPVPHRHLIRGQKRSIAPCPPAGRTSFAPCRGEEPWKRLRAVTNRPRATLQRLPHGRSPSWCSENILLWYLAADPALLSNQRDEPTSAEMLDLGSVVGHGQTDEGLLQAIPHRDDQSPR
jgi:hypothetical protein